MQIQSDDPKPEGLAGQPSVEEKDAPNGTEMPVTGTACKRRSFQFSPKYGPALRACFCLQAAFFLLTAMVLDTGRLNRMCQLAIVGQWLGIFLVLGRRPLSPTLSDLLFIRYGIMPLLVAMPFLAGLVWKVVGESPLTGLDRLQRLFQK
jgi:hypothetical protein